MYEWASARAATEVRAIVGDVLGKYHPHGDAVVYDPSSAWPSRSPCAIRWSTARATSGRSTATPPPPCATRSAPDRDRVELLADIEKETVDFVDNYDGTQEPTVLPAKCPTCSSTARPASRSGWRRTSRRTTLWRSWRRDDRPHRRPGRDGRRPARHLLPARLPHRRHDLPLREAAEPAERPVGAGRRHPRDDGLRPGTGRHARPVRVRNYGANRLYHNNHDGTFTDVAEKAGVALGTWSTGATFGDYDGDGKLDLFVDGYIRLDLTILRYSGPKAVGFAFCQYRGVQVMCGPRGLKGEHDHLFHNNGDGTFTDVSKKLGVDDPNGYYGLGALFADVNGDGKPDLLVANDSTPNYLYINKGDGTFEDDSYASGYALNEDGREIANMGIAAGDYENNGHLRSCEHQLCRRLRCALPE